MVENLVIGATGLVGGAVFDELDRTGQNVLGTCFSQKSSDFMTMDLRDTGSILTVLNKVLPSTIYICAAITNVDKCEIDATTYQVNVDAIKTIFAYANSRNIRLVYLSSSYVFDGRSSRPYTIYDSPNPLNCYGIQKLLSEKLLLSGLDKHIIVRTSSVFGSSEVAMKNFAFQVIHALVQEEKTINVPVDQYINPILVEDLASNIIHCVSMGYSGLVHIGGSECVNKFEYARDIARECGLDASRIISYNKNIRSQPALRPLNGCLQNTVTPKHEYIESLKVFANAFQK